MGRKKAKKVSKEGNRFSYYASKCGGSELSEDKIKNMLHILELKNTKFDTPEEQDEFINNSFDMIKDEEINYSTNQLGCLFIEVFLPLASDDIVMRFVDAFGEDLRPLVTDPFASHVVRRLVGIAGKRGSLVNKDAKLGEAYDQWLLKCSNFVMDNLEDFILEPYANYVVQSCLKALAGMKEERDHRTPVHEIEPNEEDSTLETKHNIPPAFKDLILEITRRLMLWPQFAQLPYEQNRSSLLNTLLEVLRAISKKSTTSLVKKLLVECFNKITAEGNDAEKNKEIEGTSATLPDAFSKPKISKLLETAIIVASPKTFSKIYADLFLNNLGKLAVKGIGSRLVQNLFDHSIKKHEFEAMYDEITPFFEEIFSSNNLGLFVSIAKACQRHSTREESFVSEIMKVLQCYEPSKRQFKFATLLLYFTTFEKNRQMNIESQMKKSNEKIKINKLSPFGTLILQTLLTFSQPIKIVASLLAIKKNKLVRFSISMGGNDIWNAFMTSKTIGEESRNRMLRKFEGLYFDLACTEQGLSVLDVLWASFNLDQKVAMLTELGPTERILESNEFVKIVASKYNLFLFNSNKDKWISWQGGSNKKRKLMEDTTEDVGKKKKVTSDGN